MLHINWVLGPRWISWWQLRGRVWGLLWVQSYSFDYQHPSDCLIVYLLWVLSKSLYPKWVFTPSKSLSRHHIKQHMRFHGQHEHQLCEESWVALTRGIIAKSFSLCKEILCSRSDLAIVTVTLSAMQVSELLHALINWKMRLHHCQVQSGYLPASTWLPGNHMVLLFHVFSRCFTNAEY